MPKNSFACAILLRTSTWNGQLRSQDPQPMQSDAWRLSLR